MALNSFNFTITKINVIPQFALDDSMFPPDSTNVVSAVDMVAKGEKKFVKDQFTFANIYNQANTENVSLDSYLEQHPNLNNIIYSSVTEEYKLENIHIPFVGGNTATLIPYNELNQNTVIEWASNTLIKINGSNAIEDIKNSLEEKCDQKIAEINKEILIKNTTPDLPWQS